MKSYVDIVLDAVRRDGDYRENCIVECPFTIEESDTWNSDHKVLHVIAVEADADGHRDSFSYDLVTRELC